MDAPLPDDPLHDARIAAQVSVEATGTRDELLAESRAAAFLKEPANATALEAMEAALSGVAATREARIGYGLAVIREAFQADVACLFACDRRSVALLASAEGPSGEAEALDALVRVVPRGAHAAIIRRVSNSQAPWGKDRSRQTTATETVPRCSLVARPRESLAVVADRRQGRRYDRRDLALLAALGERMAMAIVEPTVLPIVDSGPG